MPKKQSKTGGKQIMTSEKIIQVLQDMTEKQILTLIVCMLINNEPEKFKKEYIEIARLIKEIKTLR